MTRIWKTIAVATLFAFAAPTVAGDASDTVTEKKSDARKTARDLKPGDKSVSDRANDAKDTASGTAAKGRKKARSAKRKAKDEANEATK